MNLRRLILREILHRKTSFVISAMVVTAAVSALVAVAALLGAHDHRTGAMLDEMNAETQRLSDKFATEMKAHEDSVRKTMKGLGFNVYIFPEGQELSEVYAEGFASKTMPENYVNKLANSPIVTVNHLLPSLTRKLKWTECNRTVILIGIRGEVPLAFKDPKKPLIQPVTHGRLALGYELHTSLGLVQGDVTTFKGRQFTVESCHSERGTKDDITIWMHLEECQDILDAKGRINEIKALECNCESLDRLGEIRAEIAGILPGTKVIEVESRALARAEERVKAKKLAASTLAARRAEAAGLRENRAALRSENENKYGHLLLVLGLGVAATLGLLAFANARERRSEIGLLRAIGVPARSILVALLARAALVGLLGVGLAILLALLAAAPLQAGPLDGFDPRSLASDIPALLLGAPALAAAAAWLPALHATRLDPAGILRHE